MLLLFTIYSAFAVFASISDRDISYEKSLRFLLQKLESAKHRVQLAHVLLQDIDIEFPGIRQRLDAEGGILISQTHMRDNWKSSMDRNGSIEELGASNTQLDFLFGDAAVLNLNFLHSGTIT